MISYDLDPILILNSNPTFQAVHWVTSIRVSGYEPSTVCLKLKAVFVPLRVLHYKHQKPTLAYPSRE